MKKILFILCILLSYRKSDALEKDSSFIESPATLETATGKIMGTLTLPANFKKGNVVLIIAGSGPTDRDGNNPIIPGKNNSLLQIAHQLADSGIASLRFDKRGIAASVGAMTKEEDLRFDTYINDAIEWIDYLKKDKRFINIAVAGHSEGSLIGMIAANGHANKFISIAGVGQNASKTLKEQLITQPQSVKDIAYPVIDSLVAGATVENVNPMLASLFRPSVQPYMISWFKYDPQVEIAKLTIPVLILQGSKDMQVSVNDAELLSKAKPKASFFIIANMNHVLKIVTGDEAENRKSYSDPSLQVADELMKRIVAFVKKYS